MSMSGEPSVEDILASIKKVIAEDNRLDANLRSAAVQDTDTILDLDHDAALPEQDAKSTTAPLITDEAGSVMRESLASLSSLAQSVPARAIAPSGETSLEDLTRELLRPALAQWLDTNLPPLVERMVAAEIARIVGRQV
jgi:cell pole-organizing protein PopZ